MTTPAHEPVSVVITIPGDAKWDVCAALEVQASTLVYLAKRSPKAQATAQRARAKALRNLAKTIHVKIEKNHQTKKRVNIPRRPQLVRTSPHGDPIE